MITASDLMHFNGTESYHRFSILFRKHVLTDGTKYIAEECGAFWLMEAIASHHKEAMKNQRLQDMQIWKFTKGKKDNGVLTCWEDTGEDQKPVITQKIEYTDFFNSYPEEEITFYVLPADDNLWVIMLTSEY